MKSVHVQCPNRQCQQKLRLNISEKHLGKKLEVTCTSCKEVFRTFIPEQIKSDDCIKNEKELFEQLCKANDCLDSYCRKVYK